jgi:hypothetical protein
MEIIGVLEQKIAVLADIAKQLKQENDALKCVNTQLNEDISRLKAENEDLKVESAKSAEECAQLNARIESLEGSLLQENSKIEVLSQEKELAKVALDDLITIIDSLVEREKQ